MTVLSIGKTRVGHREISTVSILSDISDIAQRTWTVEDAVDVVASLGSYLKEELIGFYETVVWGGRNRDKIAHMEMTHDPEYAMKRHEEIAEDVRRNPGKYGLGTLF